MAHISGLFMQITWPYKKMRLFSQVENIQNVRVLASRASEFPNRKVAPEISAGVACGTCLRMILGESAAHICIGETAASLPHQNF